MLPYKACCLLCNGPQLAHVEVVNRDGKSLAKRNPNYSLRRLLLNPAKRCRLNSPRDIDLRFRASLRLQLALRLVVRFQLFYLFKRSMKIYQRVCSERRHRNSEAGESPKRKDTTQRQEVSMLTKGSSTFAYKSASCEIEVARTEVTCSTD